MKVVCKSCKKQIYIEKHDFCPKCGANFQYKNKKETSWDKLQKIVCPNKEAENALLDIIVGNVGPVIFALLVILVFWLFGLL